MLEPEGGDAAKGLPLFPEGTDEITSIGVYRLEPIDEGALGSLPPESDEETIRRHWGGGVFRVSAKGSDGKFARTKIVTIGGCDPKFESGDARRRYKNKMRGLDDDGPEPVAIPVPAGGAPAEVLTIMSQAHTQQLQMLRLQMEAQRQDALDREARARREGEEARQRDREFNATMLAIMKKDDRAAAAATVNPTDLVGMLMQGLQLGRKLSAGAAENSGPSDPVTAFLMSLPTVLEQGRALLSAGAAPAAPPQGRPGEFTISGNTAEKLRSHLRTLMGKGYSEAQALELGERALALGVEQLAAVPNAPTVPETPPAPPPPAAAPPEVVIPEVVRATEHVTRATPIRRAPRPSGRPADRTNRRR